MNPRLPVAALALLVAGCPYTPAAHDGSAQHGASPAVAAPAASSVDAAIAGADWERAIELRIELRDYGFTPSELRVKAGQAYRLSVYNIGGVAHYLNAPEFLRTIASRRVVVSDQVEIFAPSFSRFEVARRGGGFTLEFVPLVKGSYRVYCHLRDEVHTNVNGTLVVE